MDIPLLRKKEIDKYLPQAREFGCILGSNMGTTTTKAKAAKSPLEPGPKVLAKKGSCAKHVLKEV